MQFPSCKTPVKKEGIRVGSLFDEFASTRFTGYAKILLGNEEHVLGLKEGSYILAQSGELRGATAFQAILEMGKDLGSVILCPLTVKQFEVTLMFNASYRIPASDASGPAPAPARTPPDSEAITRVKPVSIPATLGRAGGRVRTIRIKSEFDEEKKPLSVSEGGSRGAKKIDQLTLESIKELKETFKTDAADLLRELHMEHLIQKGERESTSKRTSENR